MYDGFMDEGRKRVLLIAASILAAWKLAHWDGRPSPALESAIADAITIAERIMASTAGGKQKNASRNCAAANWSKAKWMVSTVRLQTFSVPSTSGASNPRGGVFPSSSIISSWARLSPIVPIKMG